MNESSLTLAEVIDAQIRCATTLVTVLDDEHAALTGRSVEALEAACDAKAAAASSFSALAIACRSLPVHAAPAPSSKPGWLAIPAAKR